MFERMITKQGALRLGILLLLSLFLSEVLAFFVNALVALLWKGRIDLDTLLVGAVDAAAVALAATVLILGLVKAMKKRERGEEESLRQTNARLLALINAVPDMVIFKDAAGRHVIVNKAVEEVTGHTAGDITGKTIEEMLPPGPAAACRKSDEESMARTGPTHTEEQIPRKDGSILYFDMVKAPVADDRGTVVGLVAVGRDITEIRNMVMKLEAKTAEQDALLTERRQAEDSLRKSEEMLRQAVEVSRIGIFDHDHRTETIYWSPEQRMIFGWGPDEAATMPAFLSCVHPEDCEKIMDAIRRARDPLGDGTFAVEYRIMRRDGMERWVAIRSKTFFDGSGDARRPLRTVGASLDITEQRLSEDALRNAVAAVRDEKNKSDAIIAAIGDGLVIVDTDYRIIYQNQSVRDMIGNLVGQVCYEAGEGRESRCENCPVERTLADGRVHRVERTRTANSQTIHMDITSSPLRDSTGRIVAVIEMVRDISELKSIQKQLEQKASAHERAEEEIRRINQNLEALVSVRTKELKQMNDRLRAEIAEREWVEEELVKAQKLESLAVLAGGIAHDFNNMLTTVLGNLSLAMMDMDRDDEAHRRLEIVETAALRAQDLTQQLLTFARGGAPVKRTVDVKKIVRESLVFALRGSRVNYDMSVQDGLWFVEADEGQLTQVLHNLVINADHAMPQGGSLNVRCVNRVLGKGESPHLPGGRYVSLAVEDTGIGIPKEHLPKIFDPYFTTKQKGSGLGLSMAYSVVRKHGGHISAESTLGVGTAFTILLPASDAVSLPQKQQQLVLPVGSGSILVMDDEEEIRHTAGDVLKRLGYSVVYAESGERALDRYREALDAGNPFALVILDLTIRGGMGGAETLRMLRELDPDVRAVVSSGYSNDPVMSDYERYGFSGVVAKPYRIRELGEVVSRVISGKDDTLRPVGD